MSVKCIAIGNRIMGDDGIGIKVAEKLLSLLEKDGIEVIIGETDIDYALERIEDGDFIFIIDATYFRICPGIVSFIPLQEVDSSSRRSSYSQHQTGVIDLINLYRKEIKGYIIGIEIENIDFNLELSEVLNSSFSRICGEIYEFINYTAGGNINA